MQGKAYTTEQRETIVKSLQPYLEMGFSRNKACEFIGLTPQTLSVWVQDDESLLMRLTAWENVVNTVAMQNIVDAINIEAEQDDARKETTKWWLERRMRQDFATKTENENTNKGNIKIEFDKSFNDSTSQTERNSFESSEVQSN